MLFFLFLCYRWRESYLSITLWGEKSKITKHCHFLFLTIWYIYDGSAFFRMLSLLSFWIHKNSHSLGKCKFSIEKLRFPVYCLTQHFIRTAVLTENLMKRLFLMISALSDGANIWADIYHDPKRLSLQVASVSEAACDIMCLKFSCYFIRLTHCCEGIWALFTALLEFIEVCSHCTSIRFRVYVLIRPLQPICCRVTAVFGFILLLHDPSFSCWTGGPTSLHPESSGENQPGHLL